MKKFMKLITLAITAVLAISSLFLLAACGEKNIAVIGREAGSGTRAAFEELIVGADGKELGETGMVKTAQQLPKTAEVLTQVSSLPSAIGYVSLGSVNDTVKKLQVNGIEATSENVTNGSYKLARPFVIMTNKSLSDSDRLTALTKDFLAFLTSTQAQAVVADEGYVAVSSTGDYTAPAEALSGKIVIRGSTSVDPLMDKLIAKYLELNKTVKADAFDKDCQGSSAGKDAVKKDTNGNVIGLASSVVSDSAIKNFNVAQDAIAVIVHKDNALTNVTIEQLYDIYTGKVLKFSELTK